MSNTGLADDKMAENLASEVIHASTDFDGRERAPMRLAEARITLGVVAARQGIWTKPQAKESTLSAASAGHRRRF